MRYVFTGGGTLGHTNPAISVAEKVREMDKEADILFIMRNNGKENTGVGISRPRYLLKTEITQHPRSAPAEHGWTGRYACSQRPHR